MPLRVPPGGFSQSCTSRSGSGYASGFRSTPSRKLKIAVLAPSPSPIVRTATAVKAGLLRRLRTAKRTSPHMLPETSMGGGWLPGSERRPDRELERRVRGEPPFVEALSVRVDGVDQPERHVQHGNRDAELGSRRDPELPRVDRVALQKGLARIEERERAHRA